VDDVIETITPHKLVRSHMDLWYRNAYEKGGVNLRNFTPPEIMEILCAFVKLNRSSRTLPSPTLRSDLYKHAKDLMDKFTIEQRKNCFDALSALGWEKPCRELKKELRM
jgi:hypothetical protein